MVPFTDEQRRLAVNLAQHYEGWIEDERRKAAMPYGMRWATRDGKDYLYQSLDRNGNAKSLGPRGPVTERVFEAYRTEKVDMAERKRLGDATWDETSRLYRAARLPTVPSKAAAILREADRRSLLGSHLLVVGTNAMPAYVLEAGARVDAPDQTDDFDMTWTALTTDVDVIWPMLRAVDSTYTVNTERPFQARNASRYEVEILAAPSRVGSLRHTDRPQPVPLPEQEWLLLGSSVSHVVTGLDGSPARLTVPDPRYFALQKLWMSGQEKRNPLKRPKDLKQGIAVLDAVQEAMPHYRLDQEFADALPIELLPIFEGWASHRPSPPPRGW